MVKRGRVEVGLTPSIHSGKPSEMVKKGEAITKDEEALDAWLDTDAKYFDEE
jgi:hypothetical protein